MPRRSGERTPRKSFAPPPCPCRSRAPRGPDPTTPPSACAHGSHRTPTLGSACRVRLNDRSWPLESVGGSAVTKGETEAAHDLHELRISSVLVICTRNRPSDLANALRYVHAASPDLSVLVADASTPPSLEDVRDVVAESAQSTLLTCAPGLARQRNQAI